MAGLPSAGNFALVSRKLLSSKRTAIDSGEMVVPDSFDLALPLLDDRAELGRHILFQMPRDV